MAHHGGWNKGRKEEAQWSEEESFFHDGGGDGDARFLFQPRLGFGQWNRGRFRQPFGYRPMGISGFRARRGGFTDGAERHGGAHLSYGGNQHQLGLGGSKSRTSDVPASGKIGGSSGGVGGGGKGEKKPDKEPGKEFGGSKGSGQFKSGETEALVFSKEKKGNNSVLEFAADDDDLLEMDDELSVFKDKKEGD
uniref:Uncharacterized protein n=1 Tax=Leersia perrieri TaxID=77586 RepID=A0A0D9X7X2_9ORYZ